MDDPKAKPIDPAALAAATVAVAVGSLFEKGPFGLMDTLVGLALLLIIVGYDDPPGRPARQSLAIAAVLGLVAVVTLGFPAELMAALRGVEPMGSDESRVRPLVLFGIWLFSAALAYVVDWNRAHKRRTAG